MAGIALLIPTILFFGVTLGSEDPYLCVEGITPVNGAIIPKHDLNLRTNGSKVKLTCNLKPDGPYSKQGATISDVVMQIIDDSTIDESMLQRKERNETSIVYEFTPARPGVFRVRCQINIKGANKALCQRHINVGSAPQDPFDFQCISENWQSLNCTWKTLPNAISTNHTIYYSEDGRFNEPGCCHRLDNQCVGQSENETAFETSHSYYNEAIHSSNQMERIVRIEICQQNGLSDGLPKSSNYTFPIYSIGVVLMGTFSMGSYRGTMNKANTNQFVRDYNGLNYLSNIKI